MVYASWYSLQKNLPDASVSIHCARNRKYELPLFQWAVKLRIPFSYNPPKQYDIVIPCDVMAVREWHGEKISEAKSNEISTFVSYKNGCGNFVLDDWIHSLESPFSEVDRLEAADMTANEQKIFVLWRKMFLVYREVG
jgi:purine nucleoside permease